MGVSCIAHVAESTEGEKARVTEIFQGTSNEMSEDDASPSHEFDEFMKAAVIEGCNGITCACRSMTPTSPTVMS